MSAALTRRAALLSSLAFLPRARAATRNLKVAIFSKHLQFIAGEDLAQAAADIGFDGVDITVRAGGHVEPASVAQDLPPLVAVIRSHGLEVPMVTTDIVDAASLMPAKSSKLHLASVSVTTAGAVLNMSQRSRWQPKSPPFMSAPKAWPR